jgi:hypothetical protein
MVVMMVMLLVDLMVVL